MRWIWAIGLLLLPGLPGLYAQDTRNVVKPHIPSACAVLTARLSASNGVLTDAAERTPDTARIQQAIDSCAQGKAVMLHAAGRDNIFLAGPLQLKAGVTLVVEANAALFASRNPRDYDVAAGSCGIVGERGPGCKTLIAAGHAPGSAIMGDGAIDGRGGAKLIGQNVTWWDLAKSAKVLDKNQAVPRLISVRQSNNFTLYGITLRNSPNFHVGVNDTDGFTAWGVKIRTPKTARNTDGIDPSSSSNVTIAYCDIDTGDDNVAIKTGAAPATHMTIAHDHFYSGHGMSIGSGTAGGVSDIRVTDLSIDGAGNGIRIKSDRSRGGLVERVTYENVCMRNVANPILLTSMYTTFSGNKLPVYRDILLKDVHSLTPGWVTYLGVDAQHRLGVTLENVVVDGQAAAQTRTENAEVNTVGGGAPVACGDRFPPFPDLPTAPAAAVTVPAADATLYVAASGTGDYYSIQHAIDVAPETGAVISIAPGTYRERLKITKPNIRLRSAYDDPKKTVIVFDDSAGSTGSTFKSATVEVHADNFTAENLTIANDYNRTHEQVSQGSQALAVLVVADRAVFRNVRLLGNQDTVYAASKGCSGETCTPARQYFSECYIEGNVDFIFGDGKAVFENCEIHNTVHKGGYVTAQGKRFASEDSTFVFNHCKLTAEPGVTDVWLGRPWRPYASVVFMNTEMGAHIAAGGWREWHPGETKYLDTAYYAEYNSSGPGGRREGRDPHTKFLSAAEAARYETKQFLAGADGWDPALTRFLEHGELGIDNGGTGRANRDIAPVRRDNLAGRKRY